MHRSGGRGCRGGRAGWGGRWRRSASLHPVDCEDGGEAVRELGGGLAIENQRRDQLEGLVVAEHLRRPR